MQRDASEITVFSVRRESACSECDAEIGRGGLLRLEDGNPLCMACADLDGLVVLPRGDAALTRRARKYSTLSAVIVRFSRTRKRYERQGLLVEEAALRRAEKECLADAEARSRARQRAATRRTEQDADYVKAFAERIGEIHPHGPVAERLEIARHACARSSGRVGRSTAAKELDEWAIDLAVQAHVRHRHSNYDELLVQGIDRQDARVAVAMEVNRVLTAWRNGMADTGFGGDHESG